MLTVVFKNISVPDFQGNGKRVFADIRKLERLETENKLIIDINPFKSVGNRTIPSRFNNTTITERLNPQNAFVFQARILPQSEPYCQASFLIEISLPPEYPFKRSKITFLDPIYHPRVHKSGKICCECRFCGGSGCFRIKPLVDIIEDLIYFIDNISDNFETANFECAAEYTDDHPTFYRKALENTLTYGRPRHQSNHKISLCI
jgi:ubiquitin-protein ligase